MARAWRLGLVVGSIVLARAIDAHAAIDVTGRWRFESLHSAELIDLAQTGSTLTFTYGGIAFTTTVEADGRYSGGGAGGPCPGVPITGRISPSGNLLDGRIVSAVPPSCSGYPAVVGLSATRCECDDGNTVDGDGCSADCRVEPCFTCTGTPSVCTPSQEGAACDDGNDCTTGTTCSGGVCGGGSPVLPICVDMTGAWSIHEFLPAFDLSSDRVVSIRQRGGDVVFGDGAPDFVGWIDPATGVFDVRSASDYYFCEFEPFTGSVAPDGNSLTGHDVTLAPSPTHCNGFVADVTGYRGICGNGTVERGESCDDGNTTPGDGCSAHCAVETCWTCTGAPSTCSPTADVACDDGNPCTSGDTCSAAGVCAGTVVPDDTACDDVASCGHGTCAAGACQPSGPLVCPACTACTPGAGCVAAPRDTCLTSTSTLQTTRSTNTKRDRLAWTWTKESATTFATFGDPTATDDYAVCLYRDVPTPTLLFRATAPAGGQCGTRPCWTKTAKAFAYADRTGASDGLTHMTLTPGAGKTKVTAKGSGPGLVARAFELPSPPVGAPLRLQLQGANGACVESRFASDGVKRDDPATGIFRAHGTP